MMIPSLGLHLPKIKLSSGICAVHMLPGMAPSLFVSPVPAKTANLILHRGEAFWIHTCGPALGQRARSGANQPTNTYRRRHTVYYYATYELQYFYDVQWIPKARYWVHIWHTLYNVYQLTLYLPCYIHLCQTMAHLMMRNERDNHTRCTSIILTLHCMSAICCVVEHHEL